MPRKTPNPLPTFEELIAADQQVEEIVEIVEASVSPEEAKVFPEEALEILPPTEAPGEAVGVIYESRIRVLDAWQYMGVVPASAPGWIDRNWIGWADADGFRGTPAGPCLRVPLLTGDLAICRVGDYVTRQEVLMLPDFPGDVRVEVWPQHQFEKLFIPTSSTAMQATTSPGNNPYSRDKLGEDC